MSRKVAFVTGASNVTGRAIAIAFAKAGYDVGFTYTSNEQGAIDTLKEIEAAGGKGKYYYMNTRDLEPSKKVLREFAAEFGPMDAMINNTGITTVWRMLDVTEEDFREIYGEMRGWFGKIRESSAYMSDIITAIKGQATTIVTDEKSTFTIDEMLKRSVLLMRHELLNSGCNLQIDYDRSKEISLEGDINNLVQVVGNLLSNAIYAQKEKGNGEIVISVFLDEQKLNILVKDRGTGINERVLPKLFKMMVTSKGTHGTGLGLYFSNIVIRGKFNGQMWGENRKDGGSIFGISIPREIVHIRKELVNKEEK